MAAPTALGASVSAAMPRRAWRRNGPLVVVFAVLLAIPSAATDQVLKVRVGEGVTFSAHAGGDGASYLWTMDGRRVDGARTWQYVPTPSDIGEHRVALTVADAGAAVRQWWTVRVGPPRPPRLVRDLPATATVTVPFDGTAELGVVARAAVPGEPLHVVWTIDGEPAGEGPTLRLRGTRAGTLRARALVTGGFGAAVAREWQVEVAAAPPPTTLPPLAAVSPQTTLPRAAPATTTLPRTAAPPSTTLPPAVVAAREPEPPAPRPAPVAPPSTLPPPEPSPTSADEVQQLLDRYAAAWRRRDVDELRRIGQIRTDAQAEGLRRYFATVEDFDVEVRVLGVTRKGDRTSVRFVRRDRFRDATGEVVSKESPAIEKDVVSTADGLRFAPQP